MSVLFRLGYGSPGWGIFPLGHPGENPRSPQEKLKQRVKMNQM